MAYSFSPTPACVVCSSTRRQYLGTRTPRTIALAPALSTHIYRCDDCDLVYPDPMPQADAGQAGENYSDSSSYFPYAIDESRLAFYGRIVIHIETAVGGKGQMLDLGCGRGELLHVAQAAGWSVCGIEPSAAFANEARQRFGVRVLDGRIESLPPPSEKFDAIALLSVLEQTSDPLSLMQAARNWLRPGGIFYLETTNQAGLMYTAGDIFHRLRRDGQTSRLSPTFPSFQVVGYSPRTLSMMFDRLDCEVLQSSTAANEDPARSLRARSRSDRALGAMLTAVNTISRMTNTGAVLTTIARLHKPGCPNRRNGARL